jgi:SAM-dependent methyltransferase
MSLCGGRKPYAVPLPTKLVSVMKDSSARSILEVGCGYGRACFFLNEKGFNVVGVDIDRTQILRARKEAES